MNFSAKAKDLTTKTDAVRLILFSVFIIFLTLSCTITAKAQPGRKQPERQIGNNRSNEQTNSNRITGSRTISQPADTVKTKSDSTRITPKSDIQTTITYSARDSINSSLDTKIMHLYGEAVITYGEIKLEANDIIIDYDKSTIYAIGTEDSLGRRIGYPVFTNGGEQYETKEILYNFKTKKARIKEVVTKQGDGLMHSRSVYKSPDNEIFARRNAYTTCDLPDPHFQIISTKSKAIPGDKVVSGPFYMEFNHVPIPAGFAFGMFPSKMQSTSGIIVPTYGEERTRGFFLRGGGYYLHISDYVDMTVTGDVYSKGSNALTLSSTYKKRYKYNGNFRFDFTNNRFAQNIEDRSATKDFRITLSHSPETKGTGRFSASVNAATSTFTNNNYLGVNTNPQSLRADNTTQKLSSNVSYSKTFPAIGTTLGINLRHNQDIQTKRVDMPLPDLSLNVNNIYPFRKIARGISSLENINIRLTTVGTNQLTNSLGLQPKISSNTGEEIVRNGSVVMVDSVTKFNFDNLGTLFKNAKKGIKHTIPLSTSLKVFKYFTLSPSVSLSETWYFDKLDWTLDSTRTKAIVKDTINGFNRISNYAFSMGMNTRIYGMARFKRGKVQVIRHVMNPSVSFSYQPDYTKNDDYFQTFQVLKNPSVISRQFDGAVGGIIQPSDFKQLVVARHQGYVYGASTQGKSSTMGFGINNTLEMKVKGKSDTVARKVSLLNSLSISSGYNFYADEFKLSPFSISANTNILDNKVNLNLSGSVDPYRYQLDSITEKTGRVYQTRIDRYVWKDKFSIGQLTSANLAFSTNLNPSANKKDQETTKKIAQSNLSESDKKQLMQNAEAYVDFSIPWSLRVNYNITYSKQGHLKSTVVQSLRMNGDFSLSEKWKITYNTGYDFQKSQFTQTSFSLTRDLHCWTLSLNWVPFGQFQSYNFYIGVKSSLLKDLKLNRTRSFYDMGR